MSPERDPTPPRLPQELVPSRAALTRVEFRRCRLTGLIASGAQLTDVRFADCKVDDANLRMTTWKRSEFPTGRGGCPLLLRPFVFCHDDHLPRLAIIAAP